MAWGRVPYRSKRKQRAATRVSTRKWYKAHKTERAAYMRAYRKRKSSGRKLGQPKKS